MTTKQTTTAAEGGKFNNSKKNNEDKSSDRRQQMNSSKKPTADMSKKEKKQIKNKLKKHSAKFHFGQKSNNYGNIHLEHKSKQCLQVIVIMNKCFNCCSFLSHESKQCLQVITFNVTVATQLKKDFEFVSLTLFCGCYLSTEHMIFFQPDNKKIKIL